MDLQTFTTLISITAGALSLGMGFLLWQYRTLPSVGPMLAAATAIAFWSLIYTLEVQSGADLYRLILWDRVKYIGLVFVEVFILLFALDFHGWHPLRVRFTPLLLVPLLALFLALTNAGNLFWTAAEADPNGTITYLRIVPGPALLLFLLFRMSALGVAMVLLVHKTERRGLRLLIVLSCMLPIVMRLLTLLLPLAVDLTPFLYMGLLGVLVFGTLRIGVFDVLPDAYDTVVRNNPDGVLVVDASNRVLAINPMFGRLIELEDTAIIGNPLFTVFPRLRQWMPDIETRRTGLAEALDHDRYIEMRIIPLLERNAFRGRAFLFRDITDRKQAEAALRESETRYRTLFDQAQDAILVEDNRLQIIDANEAASRLLGYSYEELSVMTSDVFQPQALRLDTPDVRSGRFEMQAVRRDGSLVELEVTIAPIPDHDRLIYMSIMRDVTERKRILSELSQRADELAALYEQVSLLEQYKTDMIRIAAHDLRHPISVIMGYLELLTQMNDNLTDSQRKYLQSIRTAANRANKMLSDILSLERIEEQALRGLQDAFNFHMMLGEVIAEYRDQALTRRQHIIIDVDPDDTPYDIVGDVSQMTEAIANLLSNAIKYTPDGGEITVRLTNNGSSLIFEVRDTGYGIAVDMQERLFRPFYRVKTTHTSHIEGTGLGLHLVKGIVERHGGSVIFRSVHGEGSTFGFRLPLVKTTVPIPPQMMVRTATSQTGKALRALLPPPTSRTNPPSRP